MGIFGFTKRKPGVLGNLDFSKRNQELSRKLVLGLLLFLGLLVKIGKAEELFTKRELELIKEHYPFLAAESAFILPEDPSDRLKAELHEALHYSEANLKIRVMSGEFEMMDLRSYLKVIASFEMNVNKSLDAKNKILERIKKETLSRALVQELNEDIQNLQRGLTLIHRVRDGIRIVFQFRLDRDLIMNKSESIDSVVTLKGYVEKLVNAFLDLRELQTHLARQFPDPLEGDNHPPSTYLDVLLDAMGSEIKFKVDSISGALIMGKDSDAWLNFAQNQLRRISRKLF